MLGLLAASLTLNPVPFSTNILLFADRGMHKNVPAAKLLLERAIHDFQLKKEKFTLLDGSEITDSQNWPPRQGLLGIGTPHITQTPESKIPVKSLNGVLNSSLDYMQVEMPSIAFAKHGGLSHYVYEPNRQAKLDSGATGNLPTCSIKLVGDLFASKANPDVDDRPIAIFVSPLSVSETAAKLQTSKTPTNQIVICAWGHGGVERPNFISFPNSETIKHYKVGFDGKKWFANLEKVYR